MKNTLFLLLYFAYYQSFAETIAEATGIFNIGTESYFFTDSSRNETLTKNKLDYRRIAFQAFYPAKKSIKECFKLTAPYGKRIKYQHCLGRKILPSKEKYPIVILSPGFGGSFLMNMTLAEELASHGYYVINIGHTFFNETPTFPDGIKIELLSMDTLMMTADNFLDAEFKKIFNRYIKIQKNDVLSLLNNLNNIIPPEHLSQIDINNIACIGYSGGGATSAEICVEDSRIKAGVNINGVIYGDAYSKSLTQPFLYINADYSKTKKAEIKLLGDSDITDSIMSFYNARKKALFINSTDTFYELTLSKTTHHNFSDLALIEGKYRGKANPKKCLDITYQYILAFLNKNQKNIESQIMTSSYGNIYYTFEIKKKSERYE